MLRVEACEYFGQSFSALQVVSLGWMHAFTKLAMDFKHYLLSVVDLLSTAQPTVHERFENVCEGTCYSPNIPIVRVNKHLIHEASYLVCLQFLFLPYQQLYSFSFFVFLMVTDNPSDEA